MAVVDPGKSATCPSTQPPLPPTHSSIYTSTRPFTPPFSVCTCRVLCSASLPGLSCSTPRPSGYSPEILRGMLRFASMVPFLISLAHHDQPEFVEWTRASQAAPSCSLAMGHAQGWAELCPMEPSCEGSVPGFRSWGPRHSHQPKKIPSGGLFWPSSKVGKANLLLCPKLCSALFSVIRRALATCTKHFLI